MKMRLKHYPTMLLMIVAASTLVTPASADNIGAITMTCGACHGANGIATNNDWPSLAGQKSGYLLDQLRAFKSGSRQNILMANLLDSMSEQDLQDIAAHYASLPFKVIPATTINENGRNVRAACISCHGMNGNTVNDTWPNLAGQNQGYLLQQLKNFSAGDRESVIMNVIASELNEQQMTDVAEYFEQIGSQQ